MGSLNGPRLYTRAYLKWRIIALLAVVLLETLGFLYKLVTIEYYIGLVLLTFVFFWRSYHIGNLIKSAGVSNIIFIVKYLLLTLFALLMSLLTVMGYAVLTKIGMIPFDGIQVYYYIAGILFIIGLFLGAKIGLFVWKKYKLENYLRFLYGERRNIDYN
jgi:hypothetical protein